MPGSKYRFVENLPKRYQLMKYALDLRIPGFSAEELYHMRTFAPANIDTTDWFYDFTNKVVDALGKRHLPICRIADGEYLFMLGFQPPTRRSGWRFPWQWMRWRIASLRPRLQLRAGGTHKRHPLYSSARYTLVESNAVRNAYARSLRRVANVGFIAADLSFCSVPFQEHFFPALRAWLLAERVSLTMQNYVPFYFVYALLTGSERGRILSGRRILVIHSATGGKREAIRRSLLGEGAAEVVWHGISADRSLYDVIDVERYVGRVDLCLFGAGIGKPAIVSQLEPLEVPCIDAGYVMEVWADPSVACSRIFTRPDDTADALAESASS